MHTPVLIIGSGIAGMMLALYLAEKKIHSTIVCKSNKPSGASFWAQGGISAATTEKDIQQHVADTLRAGAGLTNLTVANEIATNARDFIADLEKYGVEFTRTKDGNYHLNQEGGHTNRRIFHIKDATGLHVSQILRAQVQQNPYVELLSNHLCIDAITTNNKCVGAYLLEITDNQVRTISCNNLVLATGGASKVYSYTTSPDTASGDGIAIAARAGATTSNLEFNQFHPTALYHPHAKCVLISEAVRGEGGILKTICGQEFMHKYDSRAALASRDIVARAIDSELKLSGDKHVLLDISHKTAASIKTNFPNIYHTCQQYGIDITTTAIPVVPAAHYTCGGISTDLSGHTNIENLYAIGETASTGLHGANRLASNSLLECGIMAKQSSKHIAHKIYTQERIENLPRWDSSQVKPLAEKVLIAHNWHQVRSIMWDYVGIVRTTSRLAQARVKINLLQQEVASFYANYEVTPDLLELRNLVYVASLIIESALARTTSCGLHYVKD